MNLIFVHGKRCHLKFSVYMSENNCEFDSKHEQK